MPTPEEDAVASYQQITAKIREVTASLLPNITVDGVTIDRASYYKMLLDMQKQARQAMIDASGGFQMDEYR